MAAYDRRSFAGGAIATTLTGSINSAVLSASIAASTGWPTGSAGDFTIVIGRGTATEEKILVASRSSLALTIASGGRGVDGTTAVAHTVGETVELCIFARDLDEANAHISETGLDHHTQYLNTARHDVEARHTFGAAYGTPAAAADVGTVAATGSGNNPAREDHVHRLGAGAIDSSGQFAAGIITSGSLAPNSVIAGKVADDAIDTDELADSAVETAKINDLAVTTGKLADANVTAAKLETSLPRGSMGVATVTTAQTAIGTSGADITSLAVTVTPTSATRILKITAVVRWEETSAADAIQQVLTTIREGATVLGQTQVSYDGLANVIRDTHTVTAIVQNPTAAAHTYKVAIGTVGTGAIIATEPSAAAPLLLIVEDVGGT